MGTPLRNGPQYQTTIKHNKAQTKYLFHGMCCKVLVSSTLSALNHNQLEVHNFHTVVERYLTEWEVKYYGNLFMLLLY